MPTLLMTLAAALLVAAAVPCTARELSIVDTGAVGDGRTLNTAAIQKAINRVAGAGGVTVVVPKGVFLSGAVFLKHGVNLRLAEGAVLKGSANPADYPPSRTRIEGHFEPWLPALVNADHCDHLRIDGPGTLDGNGAPFWSEFMSRHSADPATTNLAVPRPRLAFIQNCHDVQIRGVTFKDSAFWNLHLYRCRNVLVENSRFQVEPGGRRPSTDGTDVDSCQSVTVRACTYSVDDDCIALKGSKGPSALEDQESLPVEHILVTGCTFERGQGVVTLGSEATVVRDVTVENCTVNGPIELARIKLRPDTPQRYEDIHYRGITLNSRGAAIIRLQPWLQYFDLRSQQPPTSVVQNVTLENIHGKFGAFGTVRGISGQTVLGDISFRNFDVRLKNDDLVTDGSAKLHFENVMVNGKPFTP